MEELNIYETKDIVNQELNVTYTPNSSVKGYSYEVIKDGESYGFYKVSTNRTSNIHFYESGTYQIKITNYLKDSKTEQLESGIYRLDLDKPYIVSEDVKSVYQLKEGESYTTDKDELNIRAYDTQDGDLTKEMKCNLDEVNFNSLGLQKLTCTVEDSAGNIGSKEITINVLKNDNTGVSAIQYLFFLILIIIAFSIIRFRRIVSLEKRIAKYSLEPIKNKNKSLFENFHQFYHKIIQSLAISLQKSELIKRHSKRYEKYLVLYKDYYKNALEIISNKIIIGCLFILVAIFSKMLQYQLLNFYEMIIPFIIGFYLPDVIFISKYKIYRNKLENDLLQAITVMNNAFKSGRSITQAVELVSQELDGPIAMEFSRIYMELNFGLEIDVVFDRFSKRVHLEEITYLTASLSVLSKTGGNIIKVFSSIEQNLFNKKKLKLELASLTGTSKIIVTALYLVPALFILFVSLVSPGYFEPFYTTELGFIFMGIIAILYIVYIFCVNKIMKVRM